jgi:hypothetical protein
VVFLQFVLLAFFYYRLEHREELRFGSVTDEATRLTASIPDNQEIAAYDVAAWPLVGIGQKVLSIPWPEPMISDLPKRQADVAALFNPGISKEQRIALARAAGVRTLILDIRFGPKGSWQFWQLYYLERQAKSVRVAGPMMRLDLY